MKETVPVVGNNLIERVDQFIKSIGPQFRTVVPPTVEEAAEVLDGFLTFAFALDNHGDLEPEQITFRVIVRATSPIVVGAGHAKHSGYRIRRVLQWPPSAARAAWAELGGD